MLHPCNATYGSSSQSIGQRIGMFMSTSLFISLNSAEFCGRWIYGTPTEETEPILTLDRYLLIWPAFQLLITIYIALFVPEKDPELQKVASKEKEMSFDDLIKDGPPLQRRRSSGKKNRNKGKKKKKRRLMRSNSRTRLTEFLETQEDASDSEKEEEESEPDLKQTLSIFWDVLHNRNLQIWFIYNFSCKAANSINANVASVYLTNDLGFPKETLSMI